MPDYNFLLETRLSQDQQLSLQILQRACRSAGLNLYLTGGPMRDLLTGRALRFLEITTEGNPLPLAVDLKTAGAERLSLHAERAFLTLSLRGVRVRVAAARAGDKVAPSTIVEDLRRRGLTLNSIGLSLNSASRGLPLDPTNGIGDIEARLIRMNHSYVFLEDPMVLLRAVRLRTRLEFALEERTEARMANARESKYLDRASDAARGQELEAIAYEPDPAAVLRALDQEQWLEAAFGKGVRAAKMNLAALARLSGVIESWEQLGLTVDTGMVAAPFLLAGLVPSDQQRLARLFPSQHLAQWKKLPAEAQAFEKRLMEAMTGGGGAALGRAQAAIEKFSAEAVVYASLAPGDHKAGRKLDEFRGAALGLRQRLPLGILRAAGLAPHSLEAESILRPLYRRLLQGEVLSDSELAEGLRAAALQLRPPPPPPAPLEELPKARGRQAKAAHKIVDKASDKPAPAAPVPPPPPAPKLAAPAKAAAKPAPPPVPKPAAKPAPKPGPKAAPKSVSKPAAKTAARAAKPKPRKAQAPAAKAKKSAPARRPRR